MVALAGLCRPWESCQWPCLDHLLSSRWFLAGWIWPHVGPAEWHWPSLVVLDVCQQRSGGQSEKRSGWGSRCVVCGVGGCVAVLVASQRLYPLPHASGIVAVEVLLCSPLVPAIGLIDASPQALPCLLVGLQVPRLQCRNPLSWAVSSPCRLVGEDFNSFCLWNSHRSSCTKEQLTCVPPGLSPQQKHPSLMSSNQSCRAEVASSLPLLKLADRLCCLDAAPSRIFQVSPYSLCFDFHQVRCCLSAPSQLRLSEALRNRYAGLLFLADVRAQCGNSAEFSTEQTGSHALKQQYNIQVLLKIKYSVLNTYL